MISIFSAPKPFIEPHIAVIQRNAIRSWKAIGAEVILVGDDAGVAEAAADLSVKTHAAGESQLLWHPDDRFNL
jgi:hypothetical protein